MNNFRPFFITLLFLVFLQQSGCKKDDDGDDNINGPSTVDPRIFSMSPVTGIKNTYVNLSGKNFGNTIQNVSVFLNGKPMSVITVTSNNILFKVLPRTGSGLISLVVNGQAVSGPYFEYIYTVNTYTFSGQPGNPGFTDGAGNVARFNQPRGITIDSQANLYVADELNHRIRRIASNGTVTTFAGSGLPGFANGIPESAQFNSPYDIDLDAINGFYYVADKLNHCIRRISLAGDVTTAVGIPGSPGYVDAPGLSARLNYPTGVAVEGEQLNLYIADGGNHCIRKMDPFNVVTTYAGAVIGGQQDGIGTAARFSLPYDIAWDSSGYLFVTDQVNNNIRRITKSSVEVKTIAGNGLGGWFDGPGHTAWFYAPAGVCSWFNEVLVCDFQNNRIRFIEKNKVVTTIAGDGTPDHLDAPGINSKYNKPGGIVRNSQGDYFITDTQNHCIRKLTVE